MNGSSNMRVLLVDDDPLVIRVAKRQLADKAFEVDTASSAEQALIRLRENRYCAVITDYEMTGETGIWLLEQLESVSPKTLRILHSGSDGVDVDCHLKSGVVQCYLSKPAPQLAEFLASLFDKSEEGETSQISKRTQAYYMWIDRPS